MLPSWQTRSCPGCLDYSHQPLTLSPAEATYIIFPFFILQCIFQALAIFLELCGPNLSDTAAQNKEKTGSLLLDPTESVYQTVLGLKSHSLSKTEVKTYVSCQRKEMSRAGMQGVCPLCPVIKVTIHPGIPEVALESSCLKIIAYRSSLPLRSVLVC